MPEKSNEKALKIIERQYNSLIDANGWDFFRGLADFAKIIQEMDQTRELVEALMKEQKAAEAVYEEIYTKALTELEDNARAVIQAVQDSAIEAESVMNALKPVQDALDGLTWSTDQLHWLDSKLFELARGLKDVGHPEIVKPFEDPNKKVKNIYGNYTFSKTYDKVAIEKYKLEKQADTATWGAWGKLPLVEQVILKPEETIKEIKAKEKDGIPIKIGTFSFLDFVNEMEAIRSGEASEEDTIFFKIKDYKEYAKRVNTYIVIELLKTEDKKEKLPEKSDTESFSDDQIKLLERFYKAFMDQTVPKDFFIKLFDYLEYADSVSAFDYITARLLEEGKPPQEELDKATKKAIARLDIVYRDILKYIEKNHIEHEGIKGLLRDYDGYKKGHIRSSLDVPTCLHNALSDIIQALEAMPEHKVFAARYIQYYDKSSTVKYFLWLQESKDFDRAKAEYDAAAKIELWGQVPLLGQIFQTMKEGKKKQESLRQAYEAGKASPLDNMGMSILVSEWEAIRDGKPPLMIDGTPRRNLMLFNMQNIKAIAERLHLRILKKYAEYSATSEMMKKESSKPVPQAKKKQNDSRFDPDKSIFYPAGNEVKIRKFSDQYHTLRIMFEEPAETGKEWFFSEIAERTDKVNQNDKRYYNAIYQISLKLKVHSLTDYFITTRQSVKITPKYLS
jgi:hypothetical protein